MTSMTEVEAARNALSEAQNAVSEARINYKRALRSLQLFEDAERQAWVEMKEAQWRAGKEGSTPPLPIPTPRAKTLHGRGTYDLMADLERLEQKSLRREEVNG